MPTADAAWDEAVPGRALGLAVANGALLVSTDTGAIISFGQADDQPRLDFILNGKLKSDYV